MMLGNRRFGPAEPLKVEALAIGHLRQIASRTRAAVDRREPQQAINLEAQLEAEGHITCKGYSNAPRPS